MPIEPVQGPGVPSSPRPYSPAIRAGGFVFVSGQGSVDMQGNFIPGTLEEEMRRAVGIVEAILAGAGLTLRQAVQVRCYLREPGDLETYNRVYRQLFQEPYPARMTLFNALPPTQRFSIEVTAYDDRAGQ